MVQFPVRARNFSLLQSIKTSSGARPASYSVGTRAFSAGVKQPRMKLATHFHLAPRLGMRGSYSSTPPDAIIACTMTTQPLQNNISALTRHLNCNNCRVSKLLTLPCLTRMFSNKDAIITLLVPSSCNKIG